MVSNFQPGQGAGPQQPAWNQPAPAHPQNPYQQIPYPPQQQIGGPAFRPVPQRPAAITFATTLMVTAGLQMAALIALVWLVILAGLESLSPTRAPDSGLYHMLNRAHLTLSEGLWVPLFGFPLAACVLGFLGLMRTAWPRIAITALGVACSAWIIWWQSTTGWWRALVVVVYIAVCVVLLWTPAATHWYRGEPASRPTAPASPQPVPAPEPDPRRWWDR